VLGFLSDMKNSRIAAPVPQAEINKIMGSVESAEQELQSEELYLVGERVKVTDGPFNGFSGMIQEVLQDKHKLRVDVTIFDRQVPLELNYNQVDKE
jgi:transcriptional antiterminator NusG